MSARNPKPTKVKETKVRAPSRPKRDFESLRKENDQHISPAAQKYWDYLSDPFNNPPARPVFYDGTYIGHTGVVPARAKGVVEVGTSGVGFVMFTLDRGPTTKAVDCPVTYTTSAYIATAAAPYATNATGTAGATLADVPYDSTETLTQLVFRPIGGALRITPRGSMTSQDGIMTMTEVPGHASQFGQTTFDNQSFDVLLQHPRTRVIRGAQLGDPSIVNQLNWHPQSCEYYPVTNSGFANSVINDIKFRGFNAANSTRQYGDCIVGIQATAGLIFEWEFVAAWEVKGSKATGLKPSIQDAHASAIIFNTLARQILSGLVGRPHHFHAAYHGALHETIRKTVAGAREWLPVGREALNLIKEVAGFLF